jgi:hypothetical protein
MAGMRSQVHNCQLSTPLADAQIDGNIAPAFDAVANLDDRLCELANQHGAELVYGLEDHRRYGRLRGRHPNSTRR